MSTNENRISPDDPRLTAFALGELEGVELAKMEAELRGDPAAQAIVAQIRVAAEQFQAALAGETVEAAASVEGRVQPSGREGRSIFRRFLLWGLPLAACLAVLLVHEGFRRRAHEPEIVAALSRPIAETAAKVPAPLAIADRIKTSGTGPANNIGDIPSSATVVDKQQFENTNAQNINDIMMYEAGTVGSRSSAGGIQPGFGKKATDQSKVESPAAPVQSEAVTLSPFEVSAARAQGYFTPNTTTGTRLANNIGDIPSSVTVVDKQQLENTNAQKVNYIAPPMPAAAVPAPSPRIRPYIQDKGFFSGSNPAGMLAVPSIIVSKGRYDAAADKDFVVHAVPVPNLGAAPPANSLMFGSGRNANSYGQPPTDSDRSGLVAPAPVPVNPASIQSQIESGASFGELTTPPSDFSQPEFSDSKAR
jgi:hypothetical protein